jgi:hypothetical protein
LVWPSRDKEKKDEDKRGVNYPAFSGGVGNVVVWVLPQVNGAGAFLLSAAEGWSRGSKMTLCSSIGWK